MLAQGNVYAMEYAITNMPAGKAVLEIGSFCGLSTIVLSYLLDKHASPRRFIPVTNGNSKGSASGPFLMIRAQ